MSNTLRFGLHLGQQDIYNDPARFKVVAAGRRFGKTFLAVIMCIVAALEETNARGVKLKSDSEVVYIGVTLEQARRNAWHLFKELAAPVVAKDKNGRLMVHENTSVITLINGVRIRLLGMDNPDAARGMKLRYAVMDEYAQMPATAWMEIIRSALIDTRGGALFIGTPKGRNHFFELWKEAREGKKDWAGFNYNSGANTFLDPEELASVAEELTRGSTHLLKQEIEANFLHPGGNIFKPEHFRLMTDPPKDGMTFAAVDLAGFSSEVGRRNSEIKQRDETAIAIVQVFPLRESSLEGANGWGWYIKEIVHGQWDVRTTALKILMTAKDHGVTAVGIEKGALEKAVRPYLEDYMREYNTYLNVEPLTHGNKSKWDRVRWALEGRAEKGRLYMAPGEWNDRLIEQACGFPSRLVHDDLLDALSYIDQLAEQSVYDLDDFEDVGFQPLDEHAGY